MKNNQFTLDLVFWTIFDLQASTFGLYLKFLADMFEKVIYKIAELG